MTAFDEGDALDLLRDEFAGVGLDLPPVRKVRLDREHPRRQNHRGMCFPEVSPLRRPG